MGQFKGFKCDKCDKEFRYGEAEYSPVSIKIIIAFESETPTNYPSVIENVVWCRECVMKTGFHKPITDNDKKIAPETLMTFEEQFAELIGQLGFIRE